MKIGVKLFLGFSFVVVAMLATVLFCLNTNKRMLKEFETLSDNITPCVIEMTEMEISFIRGNRRSQRNQNDRER